MAKDLFGNEREPRIKKSNEQKSLFARTGPGIKRDQYEKEGVAKYWDPDRKKWVKKQTKKLV